MTATTTANVATTMLPIGESKGGLTPAESTAMAAAKKAGVLVWAHYTLDTLAAAMDAKDAGVPVQKAWDATAIRHAIASKATKPTTPVVKAAATVVSPVVTKPAPTPTTAAQRDSVATVTKAAAEFATVAHHLAYAAVGLRAMGFGSGTNNGELAELVRQLESGRDMVLARSKAASDLATKQAVPAAPVVKPVTPTVVQMAAATVAAPVVVKPEQAAQTVAAKPVATTPVAKQPTAKQLLVAEATKLGCKVAKSTTAKTLEARIAKAKATPVATVPVVKAAAVATLLKKVKAATVAAGTLLVADGKGGTTVATEAQLWAALNELTAGKLAA